MSDENFLRRWSRRKQDVAKEDAKAAPQAGEKTEIAKAEPGAQPAAPPVDLAKLPTLEEITAETDITGFLRPGVPADLARAALRRAWAEDPAVRDFVGLQENDWVFNKPGPAEGFGPLGPEHDVQKMLANVFGDQPKGEKEPVSDPVQPQIAKSEPISPQSQAAPPEAAPAEIPPSDSDVATHNEKTEVGHRTHGGALPTPISKT